MKLILGLTTLTLLLPLIEVSARESRHLTNKADMRTSRFRDRNLVDFEFREMREQRRALLEKAQQQEKTQDEESIQLDNE